MPSQTLEQKISAFESLGQALPEIPLLISNNLNPEMQLRPYQIEAFKRLIFYMNNKAIRQKPSQLLFHMATGSGKTLIMAGAILYLYSLGYRNFLFFVNSTNIIKKTKDNFLNPGSIKYLFNQVIALTDKKLTVREIDNFQHGNKDDINMIFTTIQGLHSRLNTPQENSITYEDFSDKKIVLISDEAHHINVDTRNIKNKSKEEIDEIVSWEGTVSNIFKQNPDNVLLEFTATVGLSDENIYTKYFDKLIFDYPLRKFREDGYSKEVKVLQADLKPIERAIQAILLNQYRRKIFEKNKLLIKPVLMFKSKTIQESKEFYEEFCEKVKKLKVSDIKQFNSKENMVVAHVFDYLKENDISLGDYIEELKNDFAENKCVSVNSQDESEEKQIAVNTLEDPKNEYRAIFAVDKLNEGWDVLNLFDIVRLYETRDAKGGKPGTTTIREAQLIGRGARYCPFQITPEQLKYCRKYDKDIENELRICEELYYHSSYNPKYISELNIALQEIGIKAKETKEIPLILKDSFINTDYYKNGVIFLNQQMKHDRSAIMSLPTIITADTHQIKLRTGHIETETLLAEPQVPDSYEAKQKDYLLKDFGYTIIRKALNRLNFYDFNNLQAFLPNITSIDEFIGSDKYLGDIKVEVSGDATQIINLSPKQKLDIAVEVLDRISTTIVSEKIEYEGTKEFTPYAVKEKIRNKTIELSIPEGEQERGIGQREARNSSLRLDLSSKDWYVFTENYGTSEEKALVKFINKTYDTLKQHYDTIYLIRNERFFQLYNFSDGRPMEPDFVLYLEKKEPSQSVHYQIFIEPKGGHLIAEDKWKEDFLLSLKEHVEIKVLWQNKKFKIWGLPFYNEALTQSQFESVFKKQLAL